MEKIFGSGVLFFCALVTGMEHKFKIGDLVRLSKQYLKGAPVRKTKCRYGIIVSYHKSNNEILYKTYWLPFNKYLIRRCVELELISRTPENEENKPIRWISPNCDWDKLI